MSTPVDPQAAADALNAAIADLVTIDTEIRSYTKTIDTYTTDREAALVRRAPLVDTVKQRMAELESAFDASEPA